MRKAHIVCAWTLALLSGLTLASGTRGDVFVSMFNGPSQDSTNTSPAGIYRYSEPPSGTMVGTIPVSQGSFPTGMTVGPDGNLYLGDAGTGEIYRFNGSTGAFMNVVASMAVDPADPNRTGPFGGFAAPGTLQFGSDGSLYVTTSNPGTAIQRFTMNLATGTGTFSNYVVSGLTNGGGLAFDPAGNMMLTDLGNFTTGSGHLENVTAAQLATVNKASGTATPTIIPTSLFAPAGILFVPPDATHPTTRMLVSDFGDVENPTQPFAGGPPAVYSFNVDGSNQGSFVPFVPDGFPQGMALDRSGNILLAALGFSQASPLGAVEQYDSSGNNLGNFASGLPSPADVVLNAPQSNWQSTTGGNFGDSGNWDRTPQSGDTVIFGNTSNVVIAARPASISDSNFVTVDNAYTVGTVIFSNTNGIPYVLANDNVRGHGLTLNNGGVGAAVNVISGSPTISAPLTLADTAGTTFFVTGNSSLIVGGSLTAATGANSLTKTGEGTLELQTVPVLNSNTAVYVNSGTLQFNVTSSGGAIASGVTVTVSADATLELAGTQSALGMPSGNRAAIVNNSIATAGLDVTAGSQIVGGIDGTGNTVVEDGTTLTADHINQASLVIGNGSTFTLAPSDASGMTLAGSLMPASGFVAGSGSEANLLGAGSGSSGGFDGSSLGGGAGGASAVPEPSALLLAAIAALGGLSYAASRRRMSSP